MAGDDLQILDILAQVLGGLSADVAVGGTVEAVLADTVLLIPLVGQGVHVSLGLQGGVEGGIEHADVGLVSQDGAAGVHTLDSGRAVQGVDGNDGLQILHLGLGEDLGGLELAAVCEAVADGTDLVHALDDAPFGVGEELEDQLDGLVVGGHGVALGVGRLTGTLVGDVARRADLLAETLRQHLVLVHVEKLILQRRATGINDQYFHDDVFSFRGDFDRRQIYSPCIISK